MKFKIPKIIIINDNEWKVVFKKILRVAGTRAYNNLGYAHEDSKEIWIKNTKSITDEVKLEILAHELLHAIEFEYELDIPHHLIYKLEKPLVGLISTGCFIY